MAIAGLLALPAAASAQSTSSFSVPASAVVLSTTNLPAQVTGEVSVSFRPDPGSGCAALASCGYSGVLVWAPGSGASVSVVKYRDHRRVHVQAELVVGDNGPGSLSATTVHRSSGANAPATCADEQVAPTFVDAAAHSGTDTFTLLGELSPTRCAGPLPSDVAGLAPRVTVATRALEAGGVRLDFRTQRSFATHGFAGTLTSTVVVTLGRPQREPPGPPGPQFSTTRQRTVTERLQLTRLTGSLSASVAGTSNPDICVLLDSCGLAGTLTLTPQVSQPDAFLFAVGPAKRPYRDFLAALGLRSGGRSAGISVGGLVTWTDRGTVTESLRAPASCSDSGLLGGGSVSFGVTGGTLQAGYQPLPTSIFLGQPLRTRCPGPIISGGFELATGGIPRARLRRRTFTIELHGSGVPEDEGAQVIPSGTITLHLRRGRIQQTVETVPAGALQTIG
jgi:hypothetical protein